MKRHTTPQPSVRQRALPTHAKDFVSAAEHAAAESLRLLGEAHSLTDQVLAHTASPPIRELLHQLARKTTEGISHQEYIQRMLLSARMGRE